MSVGYDILKRPNKAEQLTMAATARVICAFVGYWPDRGAGVEHLFAVIVFTYLYPKRERGEEIEN